MKLKYAMALWNSDMDIDDGNKSLPRIAVVDHREFEKNRQFNFLRKSMGSCCSGFKNCSPYGQAAHMLALMNIIVFKHGVPAKEAHEAFMEIDEYSDWIRDRGTDENPFADVYWHYQEMVIPRFEYAKVS